MAHTIISGTNANHRDAEDTEVAFLRKKKLRVLSASVVNVRMVVFSPELR
jgi:hypothetical protein